eukprot:XP_019926488.1 PREDICTED: serine/threonine-protein kinase Nek9-like [Crassostrea gigas]
MEKEVYTWANVQGGSEIVGQLGHGNTSAYKAPKKVEELEDVIQVSCGEDFTFCVSDEGKVYAFGSNYYGCLGLEEEDDTVLSPVPLPFFSSNPVEEISCGENHVAALTKDGEVYTWGCGEFGRLGLGSEDDFSTPQKVATPGKHLFKHVVCGSDGTFLITVNGRVLAAGSNEHNKLGFNSETSGLRKSKVQVYDIPCKYTFSTVKPLTRYIITKVAAGKDHSAAVDSDLDQVIYDCLLCRIHSFLAHRDEIFEEPVKKWRDVHGNNALAMMYEDPTRWALALQTYIQLTMLELHQSETDKPVKLMERSIYSAKYCFVENHFKSGMMPGLEYVVLTEWFNWIIKNNHCNVDLIVYLQAKPETVYQRIRNRNRHEEQNISLDYLKSLHDLHEDWLVKRTKFSLPSKVLVIPADNDLEEMHRIYDKKEKEILCGV